MAVENVTLADVEEKIHAIEHELYPEVVAKLVKEI